MNLTSAQLQYFSREWQNLFTDLQNRGYNVMYDNGIIQIQNAENRMNVCLVGGRWYIELEKPFGEPDLTKTTDCTVAIGRIEQFLLKAKKKRFVYSFALSQTVYQSTGTYGKETGEMKIPQTHDDVSPDFKWNAIDAQIGAMLLRFEGTPQAITRFVELQKNLTHYAYWFYLSTLWVSYSGWSDLQLWKRLFRASRPKRMTSIMKPSELTEFRKLPNRITVYRAHRDGETDWISYTLDAEIAKRFARERGVTEIVRYELWKQDVVALFLRRDEQELLMLDPGRAKKMETVPV